MQLYCLKLSRIKNVYKVPSVNYSVIINMIKNKVTDEDQLLDPRIRSIKHKLLYCDYIEKNKLKLGYSENIILKKKLAYKFKLEQQLKERMTVSISVALKYLNNQDLILHDQTDKPVENINVQETPNAAPINMPYASTDQYKTVPIETVNCKTEDIMPILNEKYKVLYEKFLKASNFMVTNSNDDASLRELKVRLGDDFSQVPSSWMTDYETYDDALQENSLEDFKYGTPDPNSKVSSIPCGGCGALLHCKDEAIPGYIPSELFLNKTDNDLKSITCQRCHFMKHYNTCLDVRVSSDEYPKLLETVKNDKNATVLLLVDLTDFPSSIWPELPAVIGLRRNIFVIGNKVDLLPPDSSKFLLHVKDCLEQAVINSGIPKENIKYTGLISAKTGYGIEQLINKLHNVWKYKSHLYLVGCTNTGKSTLFNTLLQSDMCKSQAVDLVQRATTSQWPGTTLNLLKFPILRLPDWKAYVRVQRLMQDNKQLSKENKINLSKLRKTKNIQLATLQGRVSHTFKKKDEIVKALRKSNETDIAFINTEKRFGLDETSEEYKHSHWFYDTPGTIQPDQILHFLTTDELMKTLPNKIISPRTFCLWPNQSLFIAGLGRLDILNADTYLRCTVFASSKLPITICKLEDANIVYSELIQTEAFVVPINDPNRLKMWPTMKSKDLETVGIGKYKSVSDVVLSSAGWIALTAFENEIIKVRAWTPEGRGIYLRTPALLPMSVMHRGMRRVGSPAYRLGRQVYYSKKQ